MAAQEEYEGLAARLLSTASPMNPAEVHGRLCGYVCATQDPQLSVWLADAALDFDAGDADLRARLVALWESTQQQLSGDSFEFEPLLPPLDCGLEERVSALSSFSSGFLAGVALAADDSRSQDAGGHLAEFLADVREISRVALDEAESDDEGDFAYAELVEYLRAGIQLCWEELRSGRSDAKSSAVH